MKDKKLNLTFLKVKKELETFLISHPGHKYQIIVKNSEFRKRLLVYVLQRIPNQYLPVNSAEKLKLSAQAVQCSSPEKLQIQKLIYQGFYQLIQEHDKPINSPLKNHITNKNTEDSNFQQLEELVANPQ